MAIGRTIKIIQNFLTETCSLVLDVLQSLLLLQNGCRCFTGRCFFDGEIF
jgi:hypothetical protein